MNTTLFILKPLNMAAKKLSLDSIVTLQNNFRAETAISVGLAATLSGLPENNLDRMITT
jgi:hypothetical protein